MPAQHIRPAGAWYAPAERRIVRVRRFDGLQTSLATCCCNGQQSRATLVRAAIGCRNRVGYRLQLLNLDGDDRSDGCKVPTDRGPASEYRCCWRTSGPLDHSSARVSVDSFHGGDLDLEPVAGIRPGRRQSGICRRAQSVALDARRRYRHQRQPRSREAGSRAVSPHDRSGATDVVRGFGHCQHSGHHTGSV
jgi:hypothetical protein